MAKITFAKQNFTAGELSPRLFGRTDLGRYDNGASTIENFLIQPHGGLTRRPGTRFIREVKDSTKVGRLIPFQFNVTQAYILEFSEYCIRVYKDGGIIVDDSSNPIEIVHPYSEADLPLIKFAQTADIMYLVHPDFAPRKLTRTGHTAWTLIEVDLLRGAMGDTNLTDTTITASARTGTVTLTSSTDIFAHSDVGRIVKVHQGFAKISEIHSEMVISSASGTFSAGNTVTGGTSSKTAVCVVDVATNTQTFTGSTATNNIGATGINVAISTTAASYTNLGTHAGGSSSGTFPAGTTHVSTTASSSNGITFNSGSNGAFSNSFHSGYGKYSASWIFGGGSYEKSGGGTLIFWRFNAATSNLTFTNASGASRAVTLNGSSQTLANGATYALTGQSSANWTLIFNFPTTSKLFLKTVSGIFTVGETVTNGSGATATVDSVNYDNSPTSVSAVVQNLANGEAELAPFYEAATISFHEGDPDATGLEHNDRLEDSAGNFVIEGFKVGQTIKVTGSTSNNFTGLLIVSVTDNVITLAPAEDLVTEAAASGHTIQGELNSDKNWQLGAFSQTTGFPRCIAFYEQRLVFAGTQTQPQTVFFSQSGDFENFERGTDADDGLVYTIGSNEVNVIRYLSSSRQLLAGTSGGEFVVRASGFDEPLNPTNTQIKLQTSYGSANIQPLQVGQAVLFLQRAERKLRELVFSSDADSYVAPDLTILAEHVTETGIKEMAYQQEPDSVAWCVLNDGTLACMTYRREEQVVAWHRHKIGGQSSACTITVTDYADIAVGTTLIFTKSDGSTVTFTSEAAGGSSPSSSLGFRPNTDNNTTADNIFTAVNAHADFTVANPAANIVTIEETNPEYGSLSCVSSDTTRLNVTTNQSHAIVESVATIPGLQEDEVYLIIQRTINGATKRYVEFLKTFDFGNDVKDSFFVDSGLTYSGSAATSISGLAHLEGETVSILADGSTHASKTVSSGAITLDAAAKEVQVGLPFTSQIQTLRVDEGSRLGSAQGKIKRISEITVLLYRSVGLKVGTTDSDLQEISFIDIGSSLSTPIPLFTGQKTIEFVGGYDIDAQILIKQDQPLPMSLLAIFQTLTVNDK